jgi:hypothetical protein
MIFTPGLFEDEPEDGFISVTVLLGAGLLEGDAEEVSS